MWYERVVRPVLFRIGGGDPEAAHAWMLHRMAQLSRMAARVRHAGPASAREVFGIRFPNPVGLAAGLDKDGVALPGWPALGFGFVEVGTVTWHPQEGQGRPRLFRLTRSEAIINRMGFPNAGATALAGRLAELGRLPVPLGISLGKSRVTPLGEAVADYLASLRVLYPYGDYFAVNISSPNTPGLRTLQDRGYLNDLLAGLRQGMAELSSPARVEAQPRRGQAAPQAARVRVPPILVKIAPDLTDAAIAEVLQACTDHGVTGVIATNTTLHRDGLDPRDATVGAQAGGLSGRPLAARTREVVAFVHREAGGGLPVVGVGGICDPSDAVRLVDAGASLVQLYTGLVFHGPGLVRRTVRALSS